MMHRTFFACAVTAAATAAITAGAGSGSAPSNPMVKTIGVGQTAIFASQDLICVNEPASGAPRFEAPGVACSSYAEPYSGIGTWSTRRRVVVTRPPNVKIVASYRR
ncbi:MAG TPA: hypothetical protein VN085_07790 [Vicinamibacterales bacterium]|nr:hypothetical protein [Vicinamibacterales bacterium]